MSDTFDHMGDAFDSLSWSEDVDASSGNNFGISNNSIDDELSNAIKDFDLYATSDSDGTKNNPRAKRKWGLNSISDRSIKSIVKAILGLTIAYKPYIYHVSIGNSVYIKFKDERMCSIRVGDHEGIKRYKYKWNVRTDVTNYTATILTDGSVTRYYYHSRAISELIKDLDAHHERINLKTLNFGNLRVRLNKSKTKTETKLETETGEKGMKTQNIAAVLMDDCKTIGCVFPGGCKIYTYKTTETFEEDDRAVIYDRNGDLSIVRVVEVHKVPQIDVDSDINYRWIVQKVDTSNYEKLEARESEFNDHLLEVQQKSVKENALSILAEKLGAGSDALLGAVKQLNGKADE